MQKTDSICKSSKFSTLASRELAEQGKKYCPSCQTIKSIRDDFSTMKVRGGVASHCKECNADWNRQYYATPKGKALYHTIYKRNRDRVVDKKLQRKFGITLAEYKIILDKQAGRCIICGRTPEENGKMLSVDHDHATGRNRDLLCNNCNVTIGFIEKNKIDTDKLKWYLERHNINY